MAYRPNYTIESSYSGIVAGVDEAGCGPWAGPVVAAAVILNPSKRPRGMNDSKKLPALKRNALFDTIMTHAKTGIGIASVAEIDTLNILQARLLAMRRAIEQLGTMPEVALIDGNRAPKLSCTVRMVVGGDSECMSIAAASIIAKVTRDRMMQALAAEFPHYGWHSNAGYGTKDHQKALAIHGVCEHHRRSFRPIRELLEAAA